MPSLCRNRKALTCYWLLATLDRDLRKWFSISSLTGSYWCILVTRTWLFHAYLAEFLLSWIGCPQAWESYFILRGRACCKLLSKGNGTSLGCEQGHIASSSPAGCPLNCCPLIGFTFFIFLPCFSLLPLIPLLQFPFKPIAFPHRTY